MIGKQTASPTDLGCLRSESPISESLLQLDVPEPAFDRGKRFVVIILESAGYERRIGIEDVLHSKRERCLIQPGAPSTAVILGSGDRQNILLLTIGPLYVFTAILSEPRHLRSGRRRQVERVGRDQVERGPLPDFACAL